MDKDDNEKLIEEIIQRNEPYLDEFRKDLEEEGLASKTIERHMREAEAYLNDFLAGSELMEMREGASGFHIDAYIGDVLIRHSGLASEDCTGRAAAGIKKFYKTMLKRGLIEEEAYVDVVETIRELSPEWKARLDLFQGLALDPFAFL